MFRPSRGVSRWFAACLLGTTFAVTRSALAEDVYFVRAVSDLTITEGRLPEENGPTEPRVVTLSPNTSFAARPYAVLEGAGEVYLDLPANEQVPFRAVQPVKVLSRADHLVFRLPDRREVKGRLIVPKGSAGGTGMALLAFKVTPPPPQPDAKAEFARARRRHYERLLAQGVAGAAWFRHEIRQSDALLPVGQQGNTSPVRSGPGRASNLEQTFDLFGGGQAVDENLQLDRMLVPPPAPGGTVNTPRAEPQVKTDGLKGITVAEMDWEARIKGKTPTLDPLAANIPADQHAVFLPGLKAAAAILSEFHGDAVPVLGVVDSRSEDRRVQRRYERQLGVSLSDLGRFAGRGKIKSLAVTGSDPYLPAGTDLAVLIETDAPDDLKAFLKSRLDDARRADPEAVDDSGERDGVAYLGVTTPDRTLSSYVATVGKSVAVSNSKTQLGRLIQAARGKTPTLAGLPEYRFFRDRYPRGDAEESAFLVLTDATIRRWCGPRWRIGSSRRVRAAAAMGEIQAGLIPSLATHSKAGRKPTAPAGLMDLGTLHTTRQGFRSETYGTLEFQTPIAELALDEVDRNEAEAYTRWRDTYQQNWRGVFDPIAVRLSARPDRLSADLTVMPLIAASQYQSYLDIAGAARIAPEAGDPHPGSLAHAVIALDVQSNLFRQGGATVSQLTNVPVQIALGWVGSSVALYLDDDPFWKELGAAEKPDEFLTKQVGRLPVAVQVEVTNGAKLALFLSGLRAFVDQSAPNVTKWENREHKGQRYVRVTEAQDARAANDGPKFALHYYASPRSLTLSLSEDVIKRVIERHQAGRETDKKSSPWLGESLALRVSRRGFGVVGTAGKSEFLEDLRARSWGNLAILNEWKRLYPDRDPVALHQELWGSTLIDPAGGRYVWNSGWATMESTVLGHPGEPKAAHEVTNPLGRFGDASLGVSFESGGLRARTEIGLVPRP